MGRSIYDEGQMQVTVAQLVNADGTTVKQIHSAQTPDARIDNMLLANNDTVPHNITFFYQVSSVNYCLGSVAVPAGTGYAGVIAIDAIPLLVPAGQLGILINNAVLLYAQAEVVVTAAKQVSIVMMGGTI